MASKFVSDDSSVNRAAGRRGSIPAPSPSIPRPHSSAFGSVMALISETGSLIWQSNAPHHTVLERSILLERALMRLQVSERLLHIQAVAVAHALGIAKLSWGEATAAADALEGPAGADQEVTR